MFFSVTIQYHIHSFLNNNNKREEEEGRRWILKEWGETRPKNARENGR